MSTSIYNSGGPLAPGPLIMDGGGDNGIIIIFDGSDVIVSPIPPASKPRKQILNCRKLLQYTGECIERNRTKVGTKWVHKRTYC